MTDHEHEDRPTGEDIAADAPSDDAQKAGGDDAMPQSEAEPVAADETADGDADLEPVDWDMLAAADERTRGQLLEALAATTAERDAHLDRLRRKQAEFDNFRKRMARDARMQRAAGQQAVAASLLEVLDDFDRTIVALEADDAARKGVELVRDKLVAALATQGLERIEAVGQPFDPNLHEAVQQVPGEDGAEPVVADELRSGWRMGDRVLRAAMVVVAQ